jgi:uncharacterized protein (TIGR02001 family)
MAFDFFRYSLAGAALSVSVLAGAAQASDLPSRKGAPAAPIPPAITWIDVAVSIKGMTDYNFRGISQTDRKPAIQGGAEVQIYNNLFYFGVYGSNVDLVTSPDAEIDFYAGIRPKFGDVTFDFGVWQYYYPAEKRYIDAAGVFWTPRNTDFTEVYGKVSYTFAETLTVGANVFYAWDWLGTGASGTYASITAKYACRSWKACRSPASSAITGSAPPISRSGRLSRRPICPTTPTGTPASPTPTRT